MYEEILPKTNDISCFIRKRTYLCNKRISLKVGFNFFLDKDQCGSKYISKLILTTALLCFKIMLVLAFAVLFNNDNPSRHYLGLYLTYGDCVWPIQRKYSLLLDEDIFLKVTYSVSQTPPNMPRHQYCASFVIRTRVMR